MKFNLIDRIEHLSAERVVAVKYVSLAEEYLADHFPTFPVLPGVMMLEAITQAGTWLLHHRTGFAKSIAVLKEARNVKYGTFVAPGQALRVELDLRLGRRPAALRAELDGPARRTAVLLALLLEAAVCEQRLAAADERGADGTGHCERDRRPGHDDSPRGRPRG